MEDRNNTEDKVKQDWRDTRFNCNRDSECMRDIMDGRRRSALENLATRYRRFSTVGFVMAIASTVWFHNPLFGFYTPWVALALCAYFLLCGLMDDWFCRGIRSIDITSMPITEVVRKALYYRKRHLQAIAGLLPMAIALIGFIVYTANGRDVYFLSGIGIGAIIGVAIGLRQLSMFLEDYRKIN